MDGEGLLPMPAEGPQFVESCHVIQMRMGIKNGTNSVEALTKGLLAKIRAAVDEDRGSGGGKTVYADCRDDPNCKRGRSSQ